MHRLFVLPALISLLCLIPASSKAQLPNEAVPRRLVERLLGFPDSKSQLLIGELPKNLPVALPIPEKAEILGSIVYAGRGYQILLDAVQPSEQVEAFYRDRLKAEGWSPPRELPAFGGFASGNYRNPDLYCKSTDGPALSLTIHPRENSFTPVNLTVNGGQQGQVMCRSPFPESDFPNSPLPPLYDPEDTEVVSSGSGGGGDQFYSSAGITTKLSSQALFSNYAAQLKKAGWTQQANGQEGGLNWSIWRFQDQKKQPWQAIMTFTQVEGKSGEYIGRITAFQGRVRD